MDLMQFIDLLTMGCEIELEFKGKPFFVSYLYELNSETRKKYGDLLKSPKKIFYISDETLKTEVFVGDFGGIFKYEFEPGLSIETHPEMFNIISW
jgi:hypothetical protein